MKLRENFIKSNKNKAQVHLLEVGKYWWIQLEIFCQKGLRTKMVEINTCKINLHIKSPFSITRLNSNWNLRITT